MGLVVSKETTNPIISFINKYLLIIPFLLFTSFFLLWPVLKVAIKSLQTGKGDWSFVEEYLVGGVLEFRKLQGIVRYYISQQGCKIMKQNKMDGRNFQLEAVVWRQTIYNVADEKAWGERQVNEDYYIQNIYKMIESVEKKKLNNQLTLF